MLALSVKKIVYDLLHAEGEHSNCTTKSTILKGDGGDTSVCPLSTIFTLSATATYCLTR